MPPALERLQDALRPCALAAAPRAGGTVEVVLHDRFHGPWASVRRNRRRRDPPASVPRRAGGASAHARLADAAAAAQIQAAEAGGLAAAMMEALGLPPWILPALDLEVRAERPRGADARRLDVGQVGLAGQRTGDGDARVAAVARLCERLADRPWRDLHWRGMGEDRPSWVFPAPPEGNAQAFWRTTWGEAQAALTGLIDAGSEAVRLRPLLRRRRTDGRTGIGRPIGLRERARAAPPSGGASAAPIPAG